MKRKIYLHKLSLSEAQERLFSAFKDQILPGEEIRVQDARGRVTAHAIKAQRSAPHFAASAMDGLAVKASDTALASERNPITLIEGMTGFWLDTGDPIPEGCNAVIKVEEVNQVNGKLVIETPVTPWQHVRSIGESVIRGQMVLPVNHQITSYDLGGVLEAGITRIKVRRKPLIGIIPTGTELVSADTIPGKGQLTEFNSTILMGYIEEWGGESEVTEIVKDQYDLIKKKIIDQVEKKDITIVIAGSSAGEEDFTVQILEELGEVLVHGVNIMPGKPVILAKVKGKPVIGLPGYPLAAMLNNYLFVRPLVYHMLGLQLPDTPTVEGVLKRKVPSDVGLEEFLRVNLAEIAGQVVVVPRKKGSAAMESLLKADGIITIPEQIEGLNAGSKLPIFILKPEREVRSNLLLIGSHDLTLDLLTDRLRMQRAGFDLMTQSVGSMAGLMSLKRQEAHLAGAHLLDENTGEYNLSFVKKVLPGQRLALINLVYRQQGLMVKPGNPKNIREICDLAQKDVLYINRQRGAGTRVLLDYWLKRLEISSEQINGYEREEYTHIGAAVAVATGSADVALGILAAAQAMELEFVPLVEEKYDLVLPYEFIADWRIQYLLDLICSSSFKTEVERLGGYRTHASGEVQVVE